MRGNIVVSQGRLECSQSCFSGQCAPFSSPTIFHRQSLSRSTDRCTSHTLLRPRKLSVHKNSATSRRRCSRIDSSSRPGHHTKPIDYYLSAEVQNTPISRRPPGRSLVTTRTIEVNQNLETPTASLSRVIYSTVQPTRIARSAGVAGSGRSGSPFSTILPSILVLAVTVGTAAVAAFRARSRAVRECRACHGYGVQRCKLCNGKGTIEWEGKMAHREPCPMCLGRRMNACTCCGGGPIMTRALFAHTQRNFTDIPTFLTTSASTTNNRLTQAIRRLRGLKPEDDEARIEQSDQFKEQIMMD